MPFVEPETTIGQKHLVLEPVTSLSPQAATVILPLPRLIGTENPARPRHEDILRHGVRAIRDERDHGVLYFP